LVGAGGETASNPNSIARSFQKGFSRSIKAIFQSRRHILSCFSRAMAASMVSAVSKWTRR